MIHNIQVLRAIAAYLVVFVHLGNLLAPFGVTEADLGVGAAGVDLFFVISGFIMVVTTNARAVTPLDFIANRIARVVPLYWLLTLFVFVLALVAPGMFGRTEPTLANLSKSLGFIPYVRGDGTVRPLLFLGWSLNVEMFFYVLFAISLWLPRATIRVAAVVSVLVVLVVAGAMLRPQSSALAFYMRPYLLEFGAGMVLGLLYPRIEAGRAGMPLAALAMVIGFAGLLLLPRLHDGGTLSAGAFATLVVTGALALERGGRALRWRPALLMGNASYSLYLVHPFATQTIAKVAARAGLGGPLAGGLLALLSLVAASFLAIATYRWIEQPLSRVARRLVPEPRRETPARGL